MNDRHEPLEYVYVFEKRLKVSVPYKPRRRVVSEVAVICLQRPTPLALDDLSRFFATLLGKIPLALQCSAKIVPVATRRGERMGKILFSDTSSSRTYQK